MSDPAGPSTDSATTDDPAHAEIPDAETLLDYLDGLDRPLTTRELMAAFGIKGSAARAPFRKLLKQLEKSGKLVVDNGKKVIRLHGPNMPRVTIIEVTGTDIDGEPHGRPVKWQEPVPPPAIVVTERNGRTASLETGERVLAELSPLADGRYEARVIRRLQPPPKRVIGVYEIGDEGGRLRPTDRKARHDFTLLAKHAGGARPGDLVLAEPLDSGRDNRGGRDRLGLPAAKVVEVLGNMNAPRAVSLISIHTHDIPVEFPEDAWAIAEHAEPPPADDPTRVDLRALALVTIDGADARDFDDAVHAEPDTDPANPGGWQLTVAIADVAYYVRSGSALDHAARQRGNSVYFPDRVVPMLPERLSNDLCSLRPHEDRPCLAARLTINSAGELIAHRFERAWMKSAARITYEQAQAAIDGQPEDWLAPLVTPVLQPLYAAYAVLLKHRQARGTLDLDLPETVVSFDDQHRIASVAPRDRLDSHRLIEEFMITANVAAAEALDGARQPALYRVHDSPDKERIAGLSDILKGMNITLAKGQVIRPAHLCRVIEQVEGHDDQRLVHQLILRAQAQARYAPQCSGHFGLALRHYAHFTSPIRRYADLIVHRGLIDLFKLGEDGLTALDGGRLDDTAEHISTTERTAIAAEREAMNRYLALYLSERQGEHFSGRISGVGRFGLFVSLDQIGADGLVPIRSLPDDYYIHDEKQHALVGRRWGRQFRMGQPIDVVLVRTDPFSGLIDLALDPEAASSRPSERRAGHQGPPPARTKAGGYGQKGPKRNKSGKPGTPRGKSRR